jgi:hypothetical protein
MAGPAGTLIRWSMQPAEEAPGGKLALFGRDGKAVLDMPAQQPWKLSVTGQAPFVRAYDDWNEPAAVVEEFARVFRGEAVSPTWQDACREVEIAATVERSLARGRTIELYDEEISEEATFKGLMAVGGCGVLFLGLLGLIVAAALDGLQLSFRHHFLWRLWPVYLLFPIVVFLGLQLLKLVFEKAPPSSGRHPQGSGGSGDEPPKFRL